MAREINVLGTKYTVKFNNPYLDKRLEGLDGFVDYSTKEIVLLNPELAECSDAISHMKMVCRHEIIHAFLYESGLSSSSLQSNSGWAENEEMIDWLAIQSIKLFDAFIEADAI